MPFITREGVRIHYEESGSGRAVVLSHAFSAASRTWAAQVDALRDQFRVITWDLRGHGQSDSPEDPGEYTETKTIDDLEAVLSAANVERAILGGMSLGGYISLAFTLSRPGRVQALMLFDTGPGFRDPAARERWNQNAHRQAELLERNGLAQLDGTVAGSAGHMSAQGLAHAARGMLTKHDDLVIRSLENISVPTLVLVGENDTPLLPAADHLAARIPAAKKVIIPGAGHFANVDQPAAFNAEMIAFLRSLNLAP